MPLFRRVRFDPHLIAATSDWLTDQELAEFSRLKAARRRQDWLAGRLAAKRLVQDLYATTLNQHFDLSMIQIGASPHGAPLVFVNHDSAPNIGISISHSHGTGFAGLSLLDREGRIGVDVQAVQAVNPKLLRRLLNRDETDAFSRFFSQQVNDGLIIYWSLKEAVFKCLRPVIPVYRRDFSVAMLPDGKTAKIFIKYQSRIEHLQAHYELVDNWCFSSVLAAPVVLRRLTQD